MIILIRGRGGKDDLDIAATALVRLTFRVLLLTSKVLYSSRSYMKEVKAMLCMVYSSSGKLTVSYCTCTLVYYPYKASFYDMYMCENYDCLK